LIRNVAELAKNHGDKNARIVLSALQYTIEQLDPGSLVKRAVRLDKGEIAINGIKGEKITLSDFDRIFVVGAGKACGRMSAALCSILGHRIIQGAITIPYNERNLGIELPASIEVTEASHPMPDRSGLEGSRKIVGVVSRATKDDLVFVLISGGGSALLPLPAAGLSLSEKQRITAKLLRSGATIQEINVVRKHLSAIKGGQLLRHTNGARVISLILSDVIDDDLSSIASGPTSPDSSTFEDSLRILIKYRLDGVNDRAMRHIQRGLQGSIPDTPKPGDRLFEKTHNVFIGNNEVACIAASRFLSRRRIKTVNLGSHFDGEAKDLGLFLARIASDLKKFEVGPFAIVLGGETTVTIAGKSGMGGRNQEAGLSCATRLPARTIVACMGTDGIDGNSDAAGSLVSANTRTLANKKGLDLARYLARHDSYVVLKETNSLIFTGRTGTNVNDIAIIYSAG
jgi:glycerate-2-kinase